MTNWWQKPYPGGTPVSLPGFPRPLHYPGNSNGYPASPPGRDVMAYKRAVSRLGRWPWRPDEWDFVYSKLFARGQEGGNVSTSGILGVQRQQEELGDTGYVGEGFYNFIRHARIPAPLPNAGEHALDLTCRHLLADAWKTFQGNDRIEPDEPDTLRIKALNKAITQIGIKESPFGSNNVMYGRWYGVNWQPWCAMFVTWCFESIGDSPSFVRGDRYSYVPAIVSDAYLGRYGLFLTNTPIPGDLVCYDFNGGEYDHVEFFEKGDSQAWSAVGGNTGPVNYSNGGAVMRQNRNRWMARKVCFVRVREP